MAQVAQTEETVSKARAEVALKDETIATLMKTIEAETAITDAELERALPALQEAESALNVCE